jgi:D-3-phosphoglycerate dehydrogenase / 2-oxoglutarate reductase
MPALLFDFDSTLIQDEGLDALFERSLAEGPEREARTRAFREITDLGMAGELDFDESLRRRLALLSADRLLVEAVAAELADRVTPSVLRHRAAFQAWAEAGGIHILSGGFRELIEPTAGVLGIPASRIHAHRFRFAEDGTVLGLDPETALARGGKPLAVRELGLAASSTWIVGDGATDLELRELGLAECFVAFVENRARPSVVGRADHVVRSMDELLELLRAHP